MERVRAANSGKNIRKLEVIADPGAWRLRTARTPAGEAGDREAGLLELLRGLGGRDAAEVEDREGRGSGLDRVEDEAGEIQGVHHVGRDAPGIASFEGVSALILADLIVQQGAAGIPTGIGVMDAKDAHV